MTKWTQEETETLHRLRWQGGSFRYIATVLGRSIETVRLKFKADNATEDSREKRRQRRRQNYRDKHPASVSVREHPESVLASRPTEAMLRERNRRLMLPEPAFGDPLPGFSALDKMPSCAVDKLR